MSCAHSDFPRTLHGASGDCRVVIGPVARELQPLVGRSRVVVLTDACVRRLHDASFPPGDVIEIGQGETSKSLETVETVFERLLALGVDTDTMIVGIGGGLVCDVAGFVGATWLRGLRVGLVPTTLLAQADAGVGGKNGVNFGGLKNLIGTIRQPSFVLCDPAFLHTLPACELRNGLAEVVKTAAVRDASLFRFLEDQAEALLRSDSDTIQHAVCGALRVKLGVVQSDELGAGERVVLNFGHTLGHALEATTGMRHGECVSIGMVFASRLSEARTGLPSEGTRRLEELLRRLGLPATLPGVDAPSVLEAVRRDKKRAGSSVRMALLRQIGDALVETVPLGELEAAVARVR
ncbi:MAG TPA: 3-dehydroquinate synthase [Polyangiaceae bacterium]|nr:3-dehydroquinate synthase [Polyangiaceae bacterium]